MMKKIGITLFAALFVCLGLSAQDVEVFKKVDKMPMFPGCEDAPVEKRELCSTSKLIQYVVDQITYPEEAHKAGKEGLVVVQFVVDKSGSIVAPKVVNKVGYGCDEEAMRIVRAMPKWSPGEIEGKPVKVQYNLPFKFKLDKKKEKE